MLPSSVMRLQSQMNLLISLHEDLVKRLAQTKTKVMAFHKGGHLTSRENWCLGERKLEVVGKYKYFGLNCSKPLRFNTGTEMFVSQGEKKRGGGTGCNRNF